MIKTGQPCVIVWQEYPCQCAYIWRDSVLRSTMGATCQTSTSGRVHGDYSGARVSRAFCRKARIVLGCVCIGLNTESPVSRKGQCRSIQRGHAVPLQRGCKHAGFPIGKLSAIDTISLGSGRACTASATAASEVNYASP